MKSLSLIKTLCYAVENQTRFACRDITEEDSRWRPKTKSPAIGWLVGHILCLHDLMASHRVCENPLLFDDLIGDFGFASAGNFPEENSLEDLFTKFKQLNSAIISVISAKDDDWLDEMFDTSGFPPNWQGKSRGKGFVLAFNHGIAHSGQIFEVKRMLGKGAWGF
jgi:uncharacterized damage-inducible protein DinB